MAGTGQGTPPLVCAACSRATSRMQVWPGCHLPSAPDVEGTGLHHLRLLSPCDLQPVFLSASLPSGSVHQGQRGPSHHPTCFCSGHAEVGHEHVPTQNERLDTEAMPGSEPVCEASPGATTLTEGLARHWTWPSVCWATRGTELMGQDGPAGRAAARPSDLSPPCTDS